MARIFVIVAVALLLTGRASAQSEANCDEIRQAIATYGYEEARRHAMSHYGAEAVETGEKKCLIKESLPKETPKKALAKHHEAKKHKHASPPLKLQPK